MAVKTYVRQGRIQTSLTASERTMYQAVDANDPGDTFTADLSTDTEAWLIGHGVIGLAPDVAVTLPVDGPSAGDLPTADGSGSYDWAAPA